MGTNQDPPQPHAGAAVGSPWRWRVPARGRGSPSALSPHPKRPRPLPASLSQQRKTSLDGNCGRVVTATRLQHFTRTAPFGLKKTRSPRSPADPAGLGEPHRAMGSPPNHPCPGPPRGSGLWGRGDSGSASWEQLGAGVWGWGFAGTPPWGGDTGTPPAGTWADRGAQGTMAPGEVTSQLQGGHWDAKLVPVEELVPSASPGAEQLPARAERCR